MDSWSSLRSHSRGHTRGHRSTAHHHQAASAILTVFTPPSRVIVRPVGKTDYVWTFLLSLAAFTGTTLQMMLALVDARDAHREALVWARAEDGLVSEQPRLVVDRCGRK